jgi:hypothetical protein
MQRAVRRCTEGAQDDAEGSGTLQAVAMVMVATITGDVANTITARIQYVKEKRRSCGVLGVVIRVPVVKNCHVFDYSFCDSLGQLRRY